MEVTTVQESLLLTSAVVLFLVPGIVCQEEEGTEVHQLQKTSLPISTSPSPDSETEESQYLVLSVHAAMMALLLIIAILVFVVIIALVAAHPRGCRAWYKRTLRQRRDSRIRRRSGVHTTTRARIRGEWRPQVLLPPPYEMATSQLPMFFSPSMGYFTTPPAAINNPLNSRTSPEITTNDSAGESTPATVTNSMGVTHITLESNSPESNTSNSDPRRTPGNHISVLTIGEDQGIGIVQQRFIKAIRSGPGTRKPPSYEEATGQ